MDYITRFKLALDETYKLFGQDSPIEDDPDNCYLKDTEAVMALFKKVYESNRRQGIEFAGNCTTVHWNAVEETAKALNCNVYFTVGYVVDAGKDFFKFDYSDVRRWLERGLRHEKVMLHAWLTLSSMEIIDFTFSSTRAEMHPDLVHLRNGLVAMAPDEQSEGFHYVPMIIKDDFLIRVQAFN